MMHHAEPGHAGGDAGLRRGFGPAQGLGPIGRVSAFQQHPGEHVLRRGVALLGGEPVEPQRLGIALVDAFALEMQGGEIALADRVAAFRRQA